MMSPLSAAFGTPNTGQLRKVRCLRDEASRSSLPAVVGKIYLFRLDHTELARGTHCTGIDKDGTSTTTSRLNTVARIVLVLKSIQLGERK